MTSSSLLDATEVDSTCRQGNARHVVDDQPEYVNFRGCRALVRQAATHKSRPTLAAAAADGVDDAAAAVSGAKSHALPLAAPRSSHRRTADKLTTSCNNNNNNRCDSKRPALKPKPAICGW